MHLAATYGYKLAWHAAIGECQMRRAAACLPPLKPGAYGELPIGICFLTGQSLMHQTLFCAHSFARHYGSAARFYFLSDGSLDSAATQLFASKFFNARVITHDELDERLAAALPPIRYPTLHAHRRRFVLLRKLTDTLAGQQGYRVFFDSDMIFWKRPEELIARAERNEPFYMADLGEGGYTLPRAVLKQKLGVDPAPGVNSGLVAACAEKVDWDLIERACVLLLDEGHDRRLLEQTLWAIVLGAQTAQPLPAADYRLVIDPPAWRAAISAARPVLLHYAWHARLPYVASEWRQYLNSIEG
ncbi:MAG: hypothetical protein KGJ37_06480 [Verrucomicrobiota bacterium]|nr:hypothetical protein [Verrucomicrobiota bacterium]